MLHILRVGGIRPTAPRPRGPLGDEIDRGAGGSIEMGGLDRGRRISDKRRHGTIGPDLRLGAGHQATGFEDLEAGIRPGDRVQATSRVPVWPLDLDVVEFEWHCGPAYEFGHPIAMPSERGIQARASSIVSLASATNSKGPCSSAAFRFKTSERLAGIS